MSKFLLPDRRCLLLMVLCAVSLAPRAAGDEALGRLRLDFDTRHHEAGEPAELLQRLEKDISYLASDELRGRDVGSEGLDLAAQYIAQSFADAGLQTELFGGSPFQTFKIPVGVSLDEEDQNRLEVTRRSPDGSPQTATPILGEDFRPLGIGGSAAAAGPLVFVGYGITAPDLGYDDYAGINAQGAVVMMIRKEPSGEEADKRFDGAKHTRHAFFETKIKNAAEHGAVAVLLINDEESIARVTDSIDRQIAAEAKRLERMDRQLAELPPEATNVRKTHAARREGVVAMIEDLQRQMVIAADGLMEITEAGSKPTNDSLPVISISRSLASKWLSDSTGNSLQQTQGRIDQQVAPRSAALDQSVTLETSLTAAEAPSSNVLGVLPGRGALASETVIVGAHYDHIGMGGPGSLAPGTVAIHNGADDNASGTTVLLSSVHEIAAKLSAQANHRRVVFIAFTGEERGLLGSEHYVRHPRFALEDTVAMVNLDMVGRLRNNDLTVYGTGTAAGFDALVDRANERTEFALFKVASGYGPSDHQSFYNRRIPVLFFFTGLHTDYHRPSDTIEKINLNGMARITDITSIVAAELATGPQRPQYAATEKGVTVRQQSRAYLGVSLQEAGQQQDEAARAGVLVTAVMAGSPAEQAGISAGDRLLSLDDRPLRTAADVIQRVGEREAGDVLEIRISREEIELSVSATLQRRPGE